MIKKYKYSRRRCWEMIGTVLPLITDPSERNILKCYLVDLLATVPTKECEQKFCKVCKGTGFDFDGQVCPHCIGSGYCEVCVKMYSTKPDHEVERSGEFVCNKCGVKFTVEHEITESGALCNDCFSSMFKSVHGYEPKLNPTPPQLPVIEKIPIRIKDQTETTILVNQWDLAHKVNEVIDRLNLLSQRVCKEK